MVNRIKVWFEVCPLYGNAIHRTAQRLAVIRPTYVDLVEDWMDADIIIESTIGDPNREHLVNPGEELWSDEVVARMECHEGDLFYVAHCSITDSPFFQEAFDKSKGVFGFLDLAEAVSAEYQYTRMPWGVDTPMFYDRKIHKDWASRPYTIYTWGCSYNPEHEGIKVIYDAITELRANGKDAKMLHSGIDYKFGEGYEFVPPTTDLNEVAIRLSKAKFANALREEEGFELMGIEGLLCGARPVYYDLPCYRYWFNNFGEFINPDNAVGNLVNMFTWDKGEVSSIEKYEVINAFRWRTIGDNFWSQILKERD